jgi:predicted RNA-binding protein with PIN domain
MSAAILLIDGYNLLHAAGMAQHDYGPGDLLRCRTRLLKWLLEKLSAAEIRAATVVFDARDPPPDRPAQVVVSGLKVLFANPEGDADVFIQNWLSRHPSPRRVTLVSGDRALQRAARACRAKFVSSDDFVRDLDRRRGAPSSRAGTAQAAKDDDSKPAGNVSASQMAHWLKVFGEVPVVEPDENDQPPTAAPPAASARPTPKPPKSHRPRRARSRQRHDDPKPTGKLTPDELAGWLNVFGDQGASGAGVPAEELRLADLERWVKQFEATEDNVRPGRAPPKKSKGSDRG